MLIDIEYDVCANVFILSSPPVVAALSPGMSGLTGAEDQHSPTLYFMEKNEALEVKQ